MTRKDFIAYYVLERFRDFYPGQEQVDNVVVTANELYDKLHSAMYSALPPAGPNPVGDI